MQGRSYSRGGGAKGAKAAFQILSKRCVFIDALKWKISLWNEFWTNNSVREFYSVTQLLVARKSKKKNCFETKTWNLIGKPPYLSLTFTQEFTFQ